jgi:hypothetical protein
VIERHPAAFVHEPWDPMPAAATSAAV